MVDPPRREYETRRECVAEPFVRVEEPPPVCYPVSGYRVGTHSGVPLRPSVGLLSEMESEMENERRRFIVLHNSFYPNILYRTLSVVYRIVCLSNDDKIDSPLQPIIKHHLRIPLVIRMPTLPTMFAQVHKFHILVIVPHIQDLRFHIRPLRIGRALCILTRYRQTRQCRVLKGECIHNRGKIQGVVA